MMLPAEPRSASLVLAASSYFFVAIAEEERRRCVNANFQPLRQVGLYFRRGFASATRADRVISAYFERLNSRARRQCR
jgi:hypothetical protein